MPNPVISRLYAWYSDLVLGQEIQDVTVLVQQLADELYATYEPTAGPHPDFWQRLNGWLNPSLTDDEQKTLYQMIPRLFYVGPKEFESLYRVAFNGPVARWMIDQLRLEFTRRGTEQALKAAVDSTWFCPITDSMRINAFYHVNRITGRDLRTDWRSLARLKQPAEVEKYIGDEGIGRVVLLEDFVGSGSQIAEAVDLAGALGALPVLVVPLLICPDGMVRAHRWEAAYGNVQFAPVMRIASSDFISRNPSAAEDHLTTKLREIIISTFAKLLVGLTPEQTAKLYGPFGFAETGSLTVLHTNCPDNTLPLIHQDSAEWTALFPRASRL